MYDPDDKKKDADEEDFRLDEEPPDTQPAPHDPGSVVVIDDDGEYD